MSDTSTPSPAMPSHATGNPARRFGAPGQKVPPFARFKGTSAWRKYRKRAREYAVFQAALKQAKG